mgnify:CR=1 FL=1
MTSQRLAEYRDERADKVEPSTLLRELNIIQHLFNIAIKEWGFAINNPCKMISKPNGIKNRERRLSNEEYNFLVKGNYPQVTLRNIIEVGLAKCLLAPTLSDTFVRYLHLVFKSLFVVIPMYIFLFIILVIL